MSNPRAIASCPHESLASSIPYGEISNLCAWAPVSGEPVTKVRSVTDVLRRQYR